MILRESLALKWNINLVAVNHKPLLPVDDVFIRVLNKTVSRQRSKRQLKANRHFHFKAVCLYHPHSQRGQMGKHEYAMCTLLMLHYRFSDYYNFQLHHITIWSCSVWICNSNLSSASNSSTFLTIFSCLCSVLNKTLKGVLCYHKCCTHVYTLHLSACAFAVISSESFWHADIDLDVYKKRRTSKCCTNVINSDQALKLLYRQS